MVMGETNGMSVIAWRVMSAHCDIVASTSAASTPARRDTSRDTSFHTAQIAAIDSSASGSRTAHSGRQVATIWFAGTWPHSSPNSFIDSANSHSVRTGLDQNSGAILRRARPPQADPVVALRHLPRDLAVVRLPRVPQPVVAGERDVQHRAQTDEGERDPLLGGAGDEIDEAFHSLLLLVSLRET